MDDDMGIGNWMMQYAEKVLLESGCKTQEEWERIHKQDFDQYITDTA